MGMLFVIIFAILHNQAIAWLALILILLIIQIICLVIQIIFCTLLAKHFDATIHSILLWPFGSIGYCTHYEQWTHCFIIEYAAPCLHLCIALLCWCISIILGTTNWNHSLPLNVHFGSNILNGIWVMNLLIATLHICIPIYPMTSARCMVQLLYRKRVRSKKEIAQILMLPSLFLTILLFLFG